MDSLLRRLVDASTSLRAYQRAMQDAKQDPLVMREILVEHARKSDRIMGITKICMRSHEEDMSTDLRELVAAVVRMRKLQCTQGLEHSPDHRRDIQQSERDVDSLLADIRTRLADKDQGRLIP